MSNDRRCQDLDDDRLKGKEAEEEFMRLCQTLGYAAHGFQHGRDNSAVIQLRGEDVIAPDVSVWGDGNSTHEIKRKYPTYHGNIGLEEYRLESLLQLAECAEVYYTLLMHGDYDKAEEQVCDCDLRPGDWLTCHIEDLGPPTKSRTGTTWRNGERTQAEILFWPVERWSVIEVFCRDRNAWEDLGSYRSPQSTARYDDA